MKPAGMRLALPGGWAGTYLGCTGRNTWCKE